MSVTSHYPVRAESAASRNTLRWDRIAPVLACVAVWAAALVYLIA